MRNNERGSIEGLLTVLRLAAIALAIVLFIWQRSFLPHVGAGQADWWRGLLQGFFVGLNFLFGLFSDDKSLEIYQSGAGHWYQFWYFFGAGVLADGTTKIDYWR